MKLEFSRQIFEKKKYSNVKFHEHAFSGSRDVPYGRMDGRVDGQRDRQTDGKT